MSDQIKITDLEILEDIADADWVVVVDVSDTTQSPEGTTKRVRKDLLKGVNWQGDWAAGSYVSDDGVSHNGSSWIANKNTTEEPSISATDWDILAIKGDKGDTGDTGPQGIQGIQGEKGNNWQGPWVPGTYQIDDVVENDGSSWIAIAVTTEEPTNLATDWELFAAKGVDGAGAGDMLKVNYDPANKNVDVFDMDNMDEGADTKIMTAAERAKLGHIAVTQSVDLDQMEADIAALANGMVYKGNWDASSGSFPGAGVAQTGWFYTVSVGGTVDGVTFVAGDRLIAIVDNASTTTFAANWTQVDATDAVQSVAGLVGVILASALRTALNVGEIIDEDNMASNDATKVPSQQSTKAYVDQKDTFSAVADIALSAGDPVGVNIEGKIAKAFRNWVAPNTSVSSSFRMIEIDTNKFVVGYHTVPSTYAFNLVCATYDPVADTVTFGSILTQTGLTSGGFDFCKLDTNKFVVVNARDSNSDAFTSICTVSGTTITQAAGQTLLVAGTFDKAACCQLDTDKFAVIYSVGSGTGNYQAVCTVSGTTVSVLYSSTSVITNINVASAVYRLAKLSSTKHVICNAATGFVVVIDSTSAYTAGTAVQPTVATGGGLGNCSIVSEDSGSFILRVGGGMRKCTVSGTTISNSGTGVTIPNDGGGDLCIFGGTVYEVHYNATTLTLSGIYRITHSTNLIRQQISYVPLTGSAFIANIGSVFLAYQGGSNFHSSKMASNFSGFVKTSAAQNDTVTVYPLGIVTGLSNLIRGALYSVVNGAWSLDAVNGKYPALSTTSLLVKN